MIPEVCRFLRHHPEPRVVGDLVGLFCEVDGIWFPPEPTTQPLDHAGAAPVHSPLHRSRARVAERPALAATRG